jgi:hypothetical protein
MASGSGDHRRSATDHLQPPNGEAFIDRQAPASEPSAAESATIASGCDEHQLSLATGGQTGGSRRA